MYLEAILKSQDSLQSNKSIFHSQGGILCFRAFVGKKLKVPENLLAMIYVRPTIHSVTKIWVPPSTSPGWCTYFGNALELGLTYHIMLMGLTKYKRNEFLTCSS
jgi:hypothetical protein